MLLSASSSAHDHGEEDLSGEAEETDHSQHQNIESMKAHTSHESSHQHTAHFEKLVENYLMMKTALTNDDLEKARTHFRNFAEEVKCSSDMNNHQEHVQKHATHNAAMLSAVSEAEDASNNSSFYRTLKA